MRCGAGDGIDEMWGWSINVHLLLIPVYPPTYPAAHMDSLQLTHIYYIYTTIKRG